MNDSILGTAIRSFRLRRRQIHNGRPWTLDDLAAATDDDKAHLSRLERGLMLPSRATVLRIAAALDLTRPETDFLLRLGGFAPLLDPPDAVAAAAATRWIAGTVRTYLSPLTLYSIDTRVWYANALWLRVMGLTPSRFRDCMQGRGMTETRFDPCPTRDFVVARYHDYPAIQRSATVRLRAAALEGNLPEETLARLLADAGFRRLWEEAAAALPEFSPAGEQSSSEVAYPGRGVLRFDTWWCPLRMDRRFLVILHMPHDLHTRNALPEIRRDPRPPEGPPCPRHGYPGPAAGHRRRAAAGVL
jgi:transcriptional regulator with XRE-family HTH domain